MKNKIFSIVLAGILALGFAVTAHAMVHEYCFWDIDDGYRLRCSFCGATWMPNN